ncbi:isoform a [Lasius niger]|uniref:Isoform a n=1 Tax=Lasius niger TaxID=67767 RepID=A0A0J7K8D0_LASNI|nr:isoform a [Lasius niger]
MNGEEEEASDAGASGLEASVADLSAADQEADGDDNGMIQANENEYTIMFPLTQPTIGCRICDNKRRRLEFLSLKDLDEHLKEQHRRAVLSWKCVACTKMFPKLHGVRCHYPKEHLLQKTLKQISDKRRTLIKNINVPLKINEDSKQGSDAEIVEIQNPELVVPVEAQQQLHGNVDIAQNPEALYT